MLRSIQRSLARGLGERPAGLGDWDLRFSLAPYEHLFSVRDETAILARLSSRLEPPSGPVLVAQPGLTDPNSQFAEVAWLRARVPWTTLFVLVPEPAQTDPLGRRLTGLAREGAIVVPRQWTAWPEMARAAVDLSLQNKHQLASWLRTVLPDWPTSARKEAVDRFMGGLRYDPESRVPAHPSGRRPSRATAWFQVGRSMKAALAIQARSGHPWQKVALEVGYFDLRAMDTAVVRAFGLTRKAIEGTVGWEWLLWRFLCGLGAGRVKA